MADDSVPLLIALVFLIFMSAFFSSVETAYSCASKIKLKVLSTNGNGTADKVLTLIENKFDKLITTVLVGNNIVNLTAATIATLFFSEIITDSQVNSSLISTVVMTLAVLIFGEITPKFIAKAYPEKIALFFYPLIIFFYYLLYPFNYLFGFWKKILSKLFKLNNQEIVTEEEIMTVVKEAEEDGTLKKDETKLIRSVIEFDDLEVCDILVPRVNMIAIDVNTPSDKIAEIFQNEGYSRLPVYKNSIDQIIGTIHEKDFFANCFLNKKSINGILQETFYTTEHCKISSLLKQLQKKRVHLAIVLDEYGGTLGLVSMEDILEELVGEIYDEFDEIINFYKHISDNQYIIDCNAPLDDFFETFNLSEEKQNFSSNTVSGFIIEYLGEIPTINKKFTFKNIEIEILKSTVKKINQIKLTVHNDKSDDK